MRPQVLEQHESAGPAPAERDQGRGGRTSFMITMLFLATATSQQTPEQAGPFLGHRQDRA